MKDVLAKPSTSLNLKNLHAIFTDRRKIGDYALECKRVLLCSDDKFVQSLQKTQWNISPATSAISIENLYMR